MGGGEGIKSSFYTLSLSSFCHFVFLSFCHYFNRNTRVICMGGHEAGFETASVIRAVGYLQCPLREQF